MLLQRGFALPLVLLTIVVVTTLAYSYLAGQSTITRISQNIESHVKARAVAESGLRMAITWVQNRNDWRTLQTNGTWVTDEPFAAGTFTIKGEDGWDSNGDGTVDGDSNLNDDDTDRLTLTVTGNVGETSHTVKAVLTPITSSAPGSLMALTDSVNFGGSTAVIDSYDSSKGPYGVDNRSSEAVVTVNATGSNKIVLYSGGEIKGDAKIGPGGNVDDGIKEWSGALITGEKGTLDEVVEMPTLTAPSGPPFDNPNEGSLSMWGSMTSTISTDRHFNSLQLWGTSKAIIDGDVTVLLDGSLQVDASAELEIMPHSRLTLYIKGNISMGGKVNESTQEPGRLLIYMLGNSYVELYSGAKLHSRLLNPNNALSVWGDSQFYGTFMGRQYQGSGGVHLDLNTADYGTGFFGNKTQYTSSDNTMYGKQIANKVTLAEDMTVGSITAYLSGPPPKLLRYAIYSDSSGEPGTLIVQSAAEEIRPNKFHWHTLSILPTSLPAGTYWLAFSLEHSNQYYSYGIGGETRVRDFNAIESGFLPTWGTSDSSPNMNISIYGISAPTPGEGGATSSTVSYNVSWS